MRADELNKVMFSLPHIRENKHKSRNSVDGIRLQIRRDGDGYFMCHQNARREREASIIDGAVAGEIFNRSPLAINH